MTQVAAKPRRSPSFTRTTDARDTATASALRDVAFVLALTQRVKAAMTADRTAPRGVAVGA